MSPRLQAADRLRRVLALVPYIAERGEVSIEDLAGAFALTRAEVEADLQILPFCGLPPYTPDRLIDVAIIDDHVSVRFAEYFEKPLRLTPAEGFTLLAAGRALLAVPGAAAAGPLAGALDKLEAALDAGDVVAVDIGDEAHVGLVREAAARGERLEIDYYSYGRDVLTTRRIDPYAVVSLRGNWYVAAYCHQAEDDRLFRTDRVRAVRVTDETFDLRSPDAVPADVFDATGEHVVVTLTVPGDATWVADAHPVESSTVRKDGRLEVSLRVAERPWLERVLLRVGPDAHVDAPSGWTDAGALAAARVLAVYRR